MAKTKPEVVDFPIPIIYPQTYLAIAEERGFDISHIPSLAGLKAQLSSARQTEVSVLEVQRLLESITAEIGDFGLGFQCGWRLPPTAYGSFGYALLCSATVEEALGICLRYWHLTGKGLDISNDMQADTCLIIFTPQFTSDNTVLRRILLEGALSSFYRGFQLILGGNEIHGELWFDFAEPDYSDQVRKFIPNVKYEMPANQFRMDKALLTMPLAMSNPTGLKFAIEQCEKEEALHDLKPNQLLLRARNAMTLSAKGYPDLERLADKLNMSARTLRRKLQLEGNKYSLLLEEARRRDALKLLGNRGLEIQKIAELLGYADPANFTRAFRHWTGQSPSQYRETRKN